MGATLEYVSLLLSHSSTRTTENHYCKRRTEDVIREVLELFDPEKFRVAKEPLTEDDKFLSGYA